MGRVELWETTGDPDGLADYEQRQYIGEVLSPNFDWDTTRHFAIMAYALSEREGRDPAKLKAARDTVQGVAEQIVSDHAQSAYGRAYAGYYWGSNGVIARTCMLLQSANHLNPDARFVDVCADQIAHLYGRNQYNRSYVTGAGIAPPEHPHHRPSGSDSVEALSGPAGGRRTNGHQLERPAKRLLEQRGRHQLERRARLRAGRLRPRRRRRRVARARSN